MRTILRGGMVFDGTGQSARHADVLIEDDMIVDIGTGLDGDRDLDVEGQTVLPGLIDCHIHAVVSGFDLAVLLEEPFSYQFYAAARNLSRTLDCGITTARDAGGADLGVKKAIVDGLIDGPDLQIAVTVLGQTGGHTDGWMPNGQCLNLLVPHPGRPPMIADGVDELRRRVREVIRAGADVIKICTTGGVLSPRDDPQQTQFSQDELDVCVYEATAAGLSVMAHAQGAQGVKNAIRAGARSIEHGIYLDDEAIDLMLTRGVWLVPTLLAAASLVRAADAGAPMPATVIEKAREVSVVHADSVQRAADAGVRIAMGTDSGVFPHGNNLQELELMRRAGMSPIQCLEAATSSAARLLELDGTIGTLAPGLRADLAIVAGDPLDFAGYRERLTYVIKRGRIVRQFQPSGLATVVAEVGA